MLGAATSEVAARAKAAVAVEAVAVVEARSHLIVGVESCEVYVEASDDRMEA